MMIYVEHTNPLPSITDDSECQADDDLFKKLSYYDLLMSTLLTRT